MPQARTIAPKRLQVRRRRVQEKLATQTESRYDVGLPPAIADKVERYAETVDVSASKAIGTLVRLGLESQGSRKREFLKRLKKNLAGDDVKQEDQLVDEFRTLILGRWCQSDPWADPGAALEAIPRSSFFERMMLARQNPTNR